MKKLSINFLVIAALTLSAVFTSCKKGKEDDNSELPKYIAIHENLSDNIDFAFLGLDGSAYFYEFQDKNPNIPQRLIICNGNKGIVDLVINFDENGLPNNILSEDVTIVLGNFVANKFDAVMITKDGESQVFKNNETDVNWDDYKNVLIGTGTKSVKSFLDIFDPSQPFPLSSNTWKWINIAVNGVTCFFGNAIGCVSAVLDFGDAVGWWETPQTVKDLLFLSSFGKYMSCTDVINCLPDFTDMASYEAERRENAEREKINAGIAILLQTGDGNVTHTGGQGLYVAGWERNAQNFYVAKLWKDGILQNLTDGTRDAQANSVYVLGNNVYVSGYERSKQGSNLVAMLWKNGVAQYLTDGTRSALAYSVFVSGSNVYVAGISDGNATLWENGIAQHLANNAFANSVFVSGNDVYVAGTTLWKNSEVQKIANGNDHPSGKSVFVSGSDVYVVRNDYYAQLFKNGVEQRKPLSVYYFDNAGFSASVNSVFVSGNDIYASGSQSYDENAVLWINGVQVNLTRGAGTASANSVFVSSDNVYAAGYIRYSPILWINGLPFSLSDGTKFGMAESVFVVE